MQNQTLITITRPGGRTELETVGVRGVKNFRMQGNNILVSDGTVHVIDDGGGDILVEADFIDTDFMGGSENDRSGFARLRAGKSITLRRPEHVKRGTDCIEVFQLKKPWQD